LTNFFIQNYFRKEVEPSCWCPDPVQSGPSENVGSGSAPKWTESPPTWTYNKKGGETTSLNFPVLLNFNTNCISGAISCLNEFGSSLTTVSRDLVKPSQDDNLKSPHTAGVQRISIISFLVSISSNSVFVIHKVLHLVFKLRNVHTLPVFVHI
jgi:hypothetical protein